MTQWPMQLGVHDRHQVRLQLDAVAGARELSLEFCNLAQWVKIGYVYELRNSRYWRQTVSRASGRRD